MSRDIRAAVLDGVGSEFAITAVQLANPQPHEIIVRVVAAGVCGTDIHVQHGGIPFPLPGVVGHEGAGIVEQVGTSVTSVVPGDKVLMTFTSCGACRNCLTAHPAYCEQFLSLNLLGGRRSDGSATLRRGERRAQRALLRAVLLRDIRARRRARCHPRSPRRRPRSARTTRVRHPDRRRRRVQCPAAKSWNDSRHLRSGCRGPRCRHGRRAQSGGEHHRRRPRGRAPGPRT